MVIPTLCSFWAISGRSANKFRQQDRVTLLLSFHQLVVLRSSFLAVLRSSSLAVLRSSFLAGLPSTGGRTPLITGFCNGKLQKSGSYSLVVAAAKYWGFVRWTSNTTKISRS